MSRNEKKVPAKNERDVLEVTGQGIVELGRVESLTGKDSVGQLTDGGGTSSNRKDRGGGAGE